MFLVKQSTKHLNCMIEFIEQTLSSNEITTN